MATRKACRSLGSPGVSRRTSAFAAASMHLAAMRITAACVGRSSSDFSVMLHCRSLAHSRCNGIAPHGGATWTHPRSRLVSSSDTASDIARSLRQRRIRRLRRRGKQGEHRDWRPRVRGTCDRGSLRGPGAAIGTTRFRSAESGQDSRRCSDRPALPIFPRMPGVAGRWRCVELRPWTPVGQPRLAGRAGHAIQGTEARRRKPEARLRIVCDRRWPRQARPRHRGIPMANGVGSRGTRPRKARVSRETVDGAARRPRRRRKRRRPIPGNRQWRRSRDGQRRSGARIAQLLRRSGDTRRREAFRNDQDRRDCGRDESSAGPWTNRARRRPGLQRSRFPGLRDPPRRARFRRDTRHGDGALRGRCFLARPRRRDESQRPGNRRLRGRHPAAGRADSHRVARPRECVAGLCPALPDRQRIQGHHRGRHDQGRRRNRQWLADSRGVRPRVGHDRQRSGRGLTRGNERQGQLVRRCVAHRACRNDRRRLRSCRGFRGMRAISGVSSSGRRSCRSRRPAGTFACSSR